jgi:catabolite regulation protein CreA
MSPGLIPFINLSSIRRTSAVIILAVTACVASSVRAADAGNVWVDDPDVEGVACHFTVPERGGLKGWLGVAEEVSDISLACRQIGPIRIKQKFSQGDDIRQRRSLFFKKMQIVRGCDEKRNVLVYMLYSDKLIEGSPKNSTSSVPSMPWGVGDQIQRYRLRREMSSIARGTVQ